MVEAVCVDPKRVGEVWPLVERIIRPALAEGFSDFDTVARGVFVGNSLLWLAWDGEDIRAAAITTLDLANGKKFCTIVACGGQEIERWGFLIGELEKFAKTEGCASVVIIGRRGWQKMLPEYDLHSIVLERKL